MAMYAKFIYPKIEVGKSHARPMMPFCFTNIVETSLVFDIFSSNDNDRLEYWEVDLNKDYSNVGPLMAQSEMEQELYGVDGKSAWMVLNPGP